MRRGMGVDIAQAALAAGHAVVATGRNTEAVADAVGEGDHLLVVNLDITSLASGEAAAQAAVDRFGRIDVLVNNAGNFYAGFFEELTPEQIERQLTTNLVGPMSVTRAVLRAGQVTHAQLVVRRDAFGKELSRQRLVAKHGRRRQAPLDDQPLPVLPDQLLERRQLLRPPILGRHHPDVAQIPHQLPKNANRRRPPIAAGAPSSQKRLDRGIVNLP
jgi:hypothetical protein